MQGVDIQKAFQQLQTLDVQNPGGWPDWVRAAAACVVAALIIGGAWWYLVAPAYESAERAQTQEQQLRKDFETKQRRAASLDAYRERLDQMEREFGEMLQQLPGRAEVANLLNDISQTRSAVNLDEEIFEPQPEIVRDFYAELPNRIIVVGAFHDMGRFVSDIAALPRIVTIEEVEITPAGSGRGDAPADGSSLRMSAIAKTYRYLDDDEMANQRAAEVQNRRGRRR